MPFLLYDATVPSFQQFLTNLSGMLGKAQAHCASQGIAPDALLQARLADDMWPFARQVSAAVSNSWGHMDGVFAGTCRPNMAPPPGDFAGLEAIVTAALAGFASLDAAKLNAVSGTSVRYVVRDQAAEFTAEDFFFTFCLPNFYFHVAAAYNILRSQGVPLGKRDYLGKMRTKG